MPTYHTDMYETTVLSGEAVLLSAPQFRPGHERIVERGGADQRQLLVAALVPAGLQN